MLGSMNSSMTATKFIRKKLLQKNRTQSNSSRDFSQTNGGFNSAVKNYQQLSINNGITKIEGKNDIILESYDQNTFTQNENINSNNSQSYKPNINGDKITKLHLKKPSSAAPYILQQNQSSYLNKKYTSKFINDSPNQNSYNQFLSKNQKSVESQNMKSQFQLELQSFQQQSCLPQSSNQKLPLIVQVFCSEQHWSSLGCDRKLEVKYDNQCESSKQKLFKSHIHQSSVANDEMRTETKAEDHQMSTQNKTNCSQVRLNKLNLQLQKSYQNSSVEIIHHQNNGQGIGELKTSGQLANNRSSSTAGHRYRISKLEKEKLQVNQSLENLGPLMIKGIKQQQNNHAQLVHNLKNTKQRIRKQQIEEGKEVDEDFQQYFEQDMNEDQLQIFEDDGLSDNSTFQVKNQAMQMQPKSNLDQLIKSNINKKVLMQRDRPGTDIKKKRNTSIKKHVVIRDNLQIFGRQESQESKVPMTTANFGTDSQMSTVIKTSDAKKNSQNQTQKESIYMFTFNNSDNQKQHEKKNSIIIQSQINDLSTTRSQNLHSQSVIDKNSFVQPSHSNKQSYDQDTFALSNSQNHDVLESQEFNAKVFSPNFQSNKKKEDSQELQGASEFWTIKDYFDQDMSNIGAINRNPSRRQMINSFKQSNSNLNAELNQEYQVNQQFQPISCAISKNSFLPACFLEDHQNNSLEKQLNRRQGSAQSNFRPPMIPKSQQNLFDMNDGKKLDFSLGSRNKIFSVQQARSAAVSQQDSLNYDDGFDPTHQQNYLFPQNYNQNDFNMMGSFEGNQNQPQKHHLIPPIPKVPQRRIQSSNQQYRKPIVNKRFLQKIVSHNNQNYDQQNDSCTNPYQMGFNGNEISIQDCQGGKEQNWKPHNQNINSQLKIDSHIPLMSQFN
eukprot:403369223